MIELTADIATAAGRMPVFVAAPDEVAECPGVIVYMDVFGPREELRDICRRFAASGYAAILPNMFYRLGSPVFPPANRRDDVVDPAAQEANGATTLAMTREDLFAILGFLDEGGARVKVGRLGAVGYCMGGRHALAAAASAPEAIAAAASIHGGRLVTDGADSPHLLLGDLATPFYFAFARDDHTCPDEHQRAIEASAGRAGSTIRCERLKAHHGWSFPERWCFDRAASDRVWERLLTMFRAGLWTTHDPLMRA